MEKFKFITLGCKVNAYESQAMKEIFLKAGYEEASSDEEITLAVINSCAVTHVAEHKSRQKVSSWTKKYPGAIIIVCGCSSQLHPSDMENIEGANIIIGNNNHQEILSLIEEYKKTHQTIVKVDKNTRLRKYQNLTITSFDEKCRAFVKIGDGCDNFCSYCIVPYTRGNLRSRPKEEILCEIKALVNNGYQEIVLSGIDSASYGKEFENYKFDDLLEDIITIPNLKRIRISSIEASQIDDRFINLIKNNSLILPHLHIPLQSGSDTVLVRMKRKYNCDQFYQKIKTIRNQIPHIALACDVIVGFPGESQEEFNQTKEFIKKCGFNFLHVFPYSPRKGTYAATMDNQISSDTKKQRVNELITLGKELENNYKNQFINKTLNVLIESYDSKRKVYHGVSENYLDVEVKSNDNIINKIVKVKYQKDNLSLIVV